MMSGGFQQNNLWQCTSHETVKTKPLEQSLTVDLAVVGAGFTGCSAALHASLADMQVCVLDANTIGFGGSGRNVGLVNAGLWLPPDTVDQHLGAEQGNRLNAALGLAPDLVYKLIAEHGIECEPVRHGTLHCAHSKTGVKDLQNRQRQLKQRGIDVTLLSKQDTATRTGSNAFFGALHDTRAGTIQPLAYCRGLARAAVKAGAAIHENTPAKRISYDGSDWLVETPNATVRAKKLLIATNAYHQAIDGEVAHKSSKLHFFQLATQPLESELLNEILPNREGCWDTAMVMSSFRLDKAGRLIMGGIGALDHIASQTHLSWAKRKVHQIFHQLPEQTFEHAWFGDISVTSNHIPKIINHANNALSIFGYSGRGIAPGTLFGQAAAKMLATDNVSELPIAPVDSHHEFFLSTRNYVYELGATAIHFVSCRK